MKNNYNIYHAGVKTCLALGLREQLLPQTFIGSIPNSTSLYWKRENPDKYLGSDYVSQIEEGLDNAKLFLDKRLALSRKAFVQLGKLYITLGKKFLRKLIKANKDVFVDIIENIDEDFPIAQKDLLLFLMLKRQQYTFWLADRKFAAINHLLVNLLSEDLNRFKIKK